MSEFVKVAKRSELSSPGKMLVEVDDQLVLLSCLDGEYYAIDDVCTHDGGPLSEGELTGDGAIACPRHGAKFDLKTGAALTMPATQATVAHEVKVEGEDIFVRLSDGEAHDMKPATHSTSAKPAPAAPSAAAAAAASPTSFPVASESTPASVAPAAEAAENAAPSGPLSEDRVREELKQVIDPELFVNIVDLGLIYEVSLENVEPGKSNVKIDMTMTSPACPAGPQLIANSKQVVGRLSGVEDVEVKLVMDPPWTPDRMTEDAKDQLGIF
jgi:metal-sulfur cluster biosynthetic enzyme/nitrite reductase/ring-hydroxylating ferredoxin subunit